MTGIFIVGNSRSGTTMMARILGNNPNVFSFRELHFFEELCSAPDLYKSLPSKKREELFARLIAVQRQGYMLVRSIDQRYLNEAHAVLPSTGVENSIGVYAAYLVYETKLQKKSIPCEQTPRNLQYLDEILTYYKDDVRVVAMLRDPRDILLSQKRKWRRK
ncbi:MAG: sulfotransferase, partial [Pseudomonadota bacterium]|nr:sulfotransferase [Pseudomonadota bacterium]